MRSYSVAALVLTIKPRQTDTQCYRVMQLKSVSIQQEGLKEEILTKIKSDFGEFSHLINCHGVCGNNNVVSFVANLLVESVFGLKKCSFSCVWLFQVQGYFSLFVSSRLNGF